MLLLALKGTENGFSYYCSQSPGKNLYLVILMPCRTCNPHLASIVAKNDPFEDRGMHFLAMPSSSEVDVQIISSATACSRNSPV